MNNTDFVNQLNCNIGETVTIFTRSGGESGRGFTGVVLNVNICSVRLITRIGPAPGCALGNACDYKMRRGCCGRNYSDESYNNGGGVYTVGSVTDIPIEAIAAIVHNAV